jgi:hypothetical protein
MAVGLQLLATGSVRTRVTVAANSGPIFLRNRQTKIDKLFAISQDYREDPRALNGGSMEARDFKRAKRTPGTCPSTGQLAKIQLQLWRPEQEAMHLQHRR